MKNTTNLIIKELIELYTTTDGVELHNMADAGNEACKFLYDLQESQVEKLEKDGKGRVIYTNLDSLTLEALEEMKEEEQNTTTLTTLNNNLTTMKTIEKIQDEINTLENEALQILENADMNLTGAKKHAEIKNRITELEKELFMQREGVRLLEEKFQKLGIHVNIENIIIDTSFNEKLYGSATYLFLTRSGRIITQVNYEKDMELVGIIFAINTDRGEIRPLVLEGLKKYLNKKIEEANKSDSEGDEYKIELKESKIVEMIPELIKDMKRVDGYFKSSSWSIFIDRSEDKNEIEIFFEYGSTDHRSDSYLKIGELRSEVIDDIYEEDEDDAIYQNLIGMISMYEDRTPYIISII